MSATASSRVDRWLFPAWVAFAIVNVALMYEVPGKETIPFHFVWISVALVYGLQAWSTARTCIVLLAVCVTTGVALFVHVRNGVIGWEEMTEVPLMTLVFLAMVWHVRRRAVAVNEARQLVQSEHRIRETQRRFIRFASHELRTPLTVARGYTELLREAAVRPQAREDAEIVLDELQKLEQISSRLLTLATIDERSSLQPRVVDMDVLLTQTTKRWLPTAAREWSIESSAGEVVADPDRLVTALDCLLDNAMRYTADGDSIAVSARRSGNTVVVQVRDDGEGIAPDAIAFVFDGFHRGPKGGTGMGLAIVKAVVEAHGGTVSADSLFGSGATFTLRLPVSGPVVAETGPARSQGPVHVAATTWDPALLRPIVAPTDGS